MGYRCHGVLCVCLCFMCFMCVGFCTYNAAWAFTLSPSPPSWPQKTCTTPNPMTPRRSDKESVIKCISVWRISMLVIVVFTNPLKQSTTNENIQCRSSWAQPYGQILMLIYFVTGIFVVSLSNPSLYYPVVSSYVIDKSLSTTLVKFLDKTSCWYKYVIDCLFLII